MDTLACFWTYVSDIPAEQYNLILDPVFKVYFELSTSAWAVVDGMYEWLGGLPDEAAVKSKALAESALAYAITGCKPGKNHHQLESSWVAPL